MQLPSLSDIARDAGVSYWTVLRHGQRGVFRLYTDRNGRLCGEPDAADKVREHYAAHGGPGGRPVRPLDHG